MDTLVATAIDGRTDNIRYRQNEFHSLHSALRDNSSSILDAISSDSGCSAIDAEREFFLVMDAIRSFYKTLDFEKSMKDERQVKGGKEFLSRRVGMGVVGIRPTTNTRFYSVLVPLAAAIAAGNCVVLELEIPHSSIDSLLLKILPSALDRDSFSISQKRLKSEDITRLNLFVDQTDSTSLPTFSTQLLSSSTSRALAFVDRTANIPLAAKVIATSRLHPHNTSPYSPDLVIVNNFLAEDFVAASVKVAEDPSASSSIPKEASQDGEIEKLVNKAEENGTVKIIHSKTSSLVVVVVQDRSSPLLATKITSPYLIILPCTSITDAVTIISQQNSTPFLATYHFSFSSLLPFLVKNIPSNLTFWNHIPLPLLYGPALPPQSPSSAQTQPRIENLNIHPRYSPHQFSLPRPVITASSLLSSSALTLRDDEVSEKSRSERMEKALEKLKPTGQRPGYAIGFFEQGILIGLGLVAVVVLPALGWGFWRVGRGLLSWLRR